MNSLLSRNASGILATILFFGQLLMVGQQIRADSGETRLRYWSSAVLAPALAAAQSALAAVTVSWSDYVWLVGTRQESRRLDSEAARLRIENHFLRQKLLRFESHTNLEAYSRSLASLTLDAAVVARGPSRSTREAVINRGHLHGVASGMAVITSTGIVGKIEAVHRGTSIVLLINDSEAGVGVMLGRSGEPGVLRGTNGSTCRLDYIGSHVRVAQGETVYTSGWDGIFPEGLPVGRIISVEQGAEMQEIAVAPFVTLNRVREVLVVIKGEHEGLPPDLLTRVRDAFPGRSGTPTGARSDFARTDADRIKRAYRAKVESQGKKIGLLSGTGPPDLSLPADSLRASRTAREEAR